MSNVCKTGEYKDVTGICKKCPVGTYSNGGGVTKCTNCTIGYYSGYEGSSSCSGCPIGTYSNEGAKECTYCEPGNFCKNGKKEPCPAGTTARSRGQSDCDKCRSDEFAQSKTSGCIAKPCPAGYLCKTDDYGRVTEKKPCPRGFYSSGGGKECWQCENIHNCFNEGSIDTYGRTADNSLKPGSRCNTSRECNGYVKNKGGGYCCAMDPTYFNPWGWLFSQATCKQKLPIQNADVSTSYTKCI